MKKFVLMLVMLFVTMVSANAQLATENSKFFDNTYVGVEVGAATPLDFSPMFPLNTVAGLKLGKELTPVFGLEVEGQVFFNENDFQPWTNTFVKGTNVGINGVTNLSNLFCGYKGTPRFFEVKANTGLGWLHQWKAGNSLTAKTALDLAFNVYKKRAHTITVTPGIWWDLHGTNKIQFNKNFAQFAVFVGYTYHFKTSNGTHHFKVYDVGAMTNEIARLNEELAKKPREVVVEKVVTKEVKVVEEKATGFGVKETVFFAFDSDVLDDNAKATLDQLGKDGTYEVLGYASEEGSLEYNKALSQRRADAVKAYLEARGAKVEKAEGLGVVFGPTTGRVAVVTLK